MLDDCSRRRSGCTSCPVRTVAVVVVVVVARSVSLTRLPYATTAGDVPRPTAHSGQRRSANHRAARIAFRRSISPINSDAPCVFASADDASQIRPD
uniref:Secreted protein n=1 Tax=Plectus sambesii TaxID=2011161 RepID=A0A914VTX3_9BILA